MIGPERALEVVGQALSVDGADEVEATLVSESGGLTRFADSIIHQHTQRSDVQLRIRVVTNKRCAAASTNRLDAESVRAAGRRALEMAILSPPDDLFPGLPADSGASRVTPAQDAERNDAQTAAATPAWRAGVVAEVVRAAGARPAAGFFSTSANEIALANTNGIRRHCALTVASFTCMVRSGVGSAHHESSSRAAAAIPVTEITEDLSAWADRGNEASDPEPGTYPVVLMPLAVAEMVQYLSYVGFGAKDVLNEESFLVERAGTAVASPLLTIADDVGHPDSLGPPFDMEGVWRQRVAVIDGGVATGPVYDTRTAAEAGTTTTGHATGSQEYGPSPMNLVIPAGAPAGDDLKALVGGIERGFLVRRFWYVNVVNQRETILTGMTRDGLFRIVDGEVGGPVHNLRFTQNVLEALQSCSAVGTAPAVVSSGWDSVVVPALRLERFTFTSATSH
jgi:PmbA protein